MPERSLDPLDLLLEFNVLDTKTIQLLAPANDALTSPCLSGPITQYSWVEGIALMTVFVMFFIELLAARFDVFGQQAHDLEASDPSKDLMREKDSDTKSALQKCEYHLPSAESQFVWTVVARHL